MKIFPVKKQKESRPMKENWSGKIPNGRILNGRALKRLSSFCEYSGTWTFLICLSAFCLMLSPVPEMQGAELSVKEGEPARSGLFLTSSGAVPSSPAGVEVLREKDSLSIAIIQYLDPETPLVSKGSEQEPEKIFHGNAMELFLAPHPEDPLKYYQFGVNPEGVLYQAQGLDPSWRPLKTVHVSVERGKDFWRSVFHIPAGAFGEDPIVDGKTLWRANFVCSSGNWAGTGDLHSPSTFGFLFFGGKTEPLRVDELFCRDGNFHVSLEKQLPVSLQVHANGKVFEMPSGVPHLNLKIPVRGAETGMGKTEILHKDLLPLSITAYEVSEPPVPKKKTVPESSASGKGESSSGKRVFSLETYSGGDRPEYLNLDRYYYDMDSFSPSSSSPSSSAPGAETEEKRNAIRLSYEAPGFAAGSGTCRIHISGIGHEYEKEFPAAAEKGMLELKGISPGEYLFRIENRTQYASCGFSVRTPVELRERRVESQDSLSSSGRPGKGRKQDGEVQKDEKRGENGGGMNGGKVGQFPEKMEERGGLLLSTEKDPRALFERSSSGELLPFYPIVGEKLRSDLSIVSCLAYRFVRTPAAGYLFETGIEGQESLASAEIQRNAGKKPGCWLFRMSYEAQMPVLERQENGEILIRENSAEFYAEIYRRLKRKHPGTLFSIQIDSQIHSGTFARNCDVFETAYWGSSYAPAMLLRLADDLAETRKTAGEKPVLFWLGASIPNGRIRTADELRCAVYLSILRGMSGNVIHLGHGGVPESRTRVWSLLKGIQSDVALWYRDWIESVPVPFTVGGRGVEASVREGGGKRHLLAVNLLPCENVLTLGGDGADPGMKKEFRLPPYGVLHLEWGKESFLGGI